MSNFELSKQLRLFLTIGSSHKYLRLGTSLSVSIRRKCHFSQVIVIYNNADWNFFTASEIRDIMSLADALGLLFYVNVENGVPVIEIEDLDSNGI